MPAGVAGFQRQGAGLRCRPRRRRHAARGLARDGRGYRAGVCVSNPEHGHTSCSGPWFGGGLPMATESACLLIADISGYTGYLADVELDHAQDILADLIGAVVTALRPDVPARQARGRRGLHVRDRRAVRRVDAARHDRALLLRLPPAAPRRAPGDVLRVRRLRAHPRPRPQVRRPPRQAILQKVAGRQELLGSDVIVVHRLLKNDVVEDSAWTHTRSSARPCIDATDLDPAALGMRAAHRDLRPHRRRPRLGARPRARAGRRKRRAPASSWTRRGGHPRPVGADERAAAGRLGVPHAAGPADDAGSRG